MPKRYVLRADTGRFIVGGLTRDVSRSVVQYFAPVRALYRGIGKVTYKEVERAAEKVQHSEPARQRKKLDEDVHHVR